MNKFLSKIGLLVALVVVVISCDKEDATSTVTKKEVIANYANIVYANYQKAYDDAVVLETAINTFTANPTDANFTAAKTAWKVSRESYATTEAFRFSKAPRFPKTNRLYLWDISKKHRTNL